MKIIKTLYIDILEDQEFVSLVNNGEGILFECILSGGISYLKLPEGKWRLLSIENNIMRLLPKSKKKAINDGWITE